MAMNRMSRKREARIEAKRIKAYGVWWRRVLGQIRSDPMLTDKQISLRCSAHYRKLDEFIHKDDPVYIRMKRSLLPQPISNTTEVFYYETPI